MSGKRKSNTENVVAEAMKEVNMAMKEVAQATAPLRKMKNGDIETDSMPYTEPEKPAAQPKVSSKKDGSLQVKKSGIFGSKTVINIQSAQNIQIGNNNTMIVNSSTRRTESRTQMMPPKAPELDKNLVKQVLGSKRLVEERDLLIASSKCMGQQWRRTLRLIGLEDIEIESKYQDFHAQGIKEVTFQAMKYYKQKNPETFTIGQLATALSEVLHCDQVCDKFKP